MNKILGFFKEYRFLSNFEPSVVQLDGVNYPTVEHAYQAAKTTDVSEREEICSASTATIAKRLGKKVTMRSDWEEVKISVMKSLVDQKFSNHRHLRESLISTEDSYLEETNYWGDRFWGVCKGKGENHLGKILMEVRSKFK